MIVGLFLLSLLTVWVQATCLEDMPRSELFEMPDLINLVLLLS